MENEKEEHMKEALASADILKKAGLRNPEVTRFYNILIFHLTVLQFDT
jgi:hypothetical protein